MYQLPKYRYLYISQALQFYSRVNFPCEYSKQRFFSLFKKIHESSLNFDNTGVNVCLGKNA